MAKMKYSRKQGDRVVWMMAGHHDLVVGFIQGVAVTEQPGIGVGWIVKLLEPIEDYPFECMVVFESCILEELDLTQINKG